MTFSLRGPPRRARGRPSHFAAALGATVSIAHADHAQPARDIAQLPYQPIGHFAHGDDIPEPDEAIAFFTPLMSGLRFNPSGTYNAYDTNVFETLMLPFRAAGDDDDGRPVRQRRRPATRGTATASRTREYPDKRPGNTTLLAGVCPNHALEYADVLRGRRCRTSSAKFGVKMKRYPITVPEPSPPGLDNTLGGEAYNLAAVVPGADHPEEHIVVGAHYDQTNDGPASTWDSAEGHAQVIRMAKQMADYWKATGTRPSATVKFIPWAGEEAGTLGSLDYAEDNVVPGEEGKVRGYWNTDPCAGGYPAYRYGNPTDRITLGIQLARPTEVPDEFAELRPRVTAFNDIAEQVVEDVFNQARRHRAGQPGRHARGVHLEGRGPRRTRTSARQGVTASAARAPCSSRATGANFLGKGIPFFNPGPEVTGPSDENEANWPDGAATFHTPRDNQVTMNQFTGQPLSVGNNAVASEAWAKGMEMCASLLSWGMLRSDQGGAQTDRTTTSSPTTRRCRTRRSPAARSRSTRGGSYQYLDKDARTYVADAAARVHVGVRRRRRRATGKVVEHSYDVAGKYTSKLTVRNTDDGRDRHDVDPDHGRRRVARRPGARRRPADGRGRQLRRQVEVRRGGPRGAAALPRRGGHRRPPRLHRPGRDARRLDLVRADGAGDHAVEALRRRATARAATRSKSGEHSFYTGVPRDRAPVRASRPELGRRRS